MVADLVGVLAEVEEVSRVEVQQEGKEDQTEQGVEEKLLFVQDLVLVAGSSYNFEVYEFGFSHVLAAFGLFSHSNLSCG